MNENIRELHAIVRGNVQGVFFRSHTKQLADQLGIVGTVKNLMDGTVEIFAQGKESRLSEFVEGLGGSEMPGDISAIETDFTLPKNRFSSFKIVY
ncbi:MAG: acylphosphatase [Waddliaceae bacterium]